MKPRITLITLGVDDLERAVRFYRDGLGLATDGIVGNEFEHGAVAFFELQAGLRLALWPRKSIAHDAGISPGRRSATEFTIGHNVSSKAEVDAVMAQANAAGAIIVKLAQETFWGGYAGYFQDPDGHLWASRSCSGSWAKTFTRISRRCATSGKRPTGSSLTGPRTCAMTGWAGPFEFTSVQDGSTRRGPAWIFVNAAIQSSNAPSRADNDLNQAARI